MQASINFSAVEGMLGGLDISDKNSMSTVRSTSLDLGVDLPLARDPSYLAAVSLSHLSNSVLANMPASNLSKALSLPHTAWRSTERLQGGSPTEKSDMRAARRYMSIQNDRQILRHLTKKHLSETPITTMYRISKDHF